MTLSKKLAESEEEVQLLRGLLTDEKEKCDISKELARIEMESNELDYELRARASTEKAATEAARAVARPAEGAGGLSLGGGGGGGGGRADDKGVEDKGVEDEELPLRPPAISQKLGRARLSWHETRAGDELWREQSAEEPSRRHFHGQCLREASRESGGGSASWGRASDEGEGKADELEYHIGEDLGEFSEKYMGME